MTCSAARLAANRRNATRSTGPKSAEGKAASRLNAFQHGLAGAGELVGPDEDAALVARRAAELARELGAVGEIGSILSHRAALMSVRMERAAERDLEAVALDTAAARIQFDEDRLDELDHWIAQLDGPEAQTAQAVLAEAPEGVDHLIAAWTDLRTAVGSGDQGEAARAEGQARAWWGLDPAVPVGDLATRIDAELARLRGLLGKMAPVRRAVAAARDRAGVLARFNPSRESTLARRYEAAAERSMYRALRGIGDARRAQGLDRVPKPPVSPQPAAAPASQPTPTSGPLGSFRAGPRAETWIAPEPPAGPIEPALFAAGRRPNRPDVRKLLGKRR